MEPAGPGLNACPGRPWNVPTTGVLTTMEEAERDPDEIEEPSEARHTQPLILIVTGSSLRAEEVDRPLGYYLQRQVELFLAESHADSFALRVISDLRWMHDESLQDLPTISIGGPGVNLLAQRWLEELPLSLAVDDEYFLQMDPDLDILRASIWGMDNSSTQVAVAAFVKRFLPRFLERCQLEAKIEPETDED
jgi:hypothetical protein